MTIAIRVTNENYNGPQSVIEVQTIEPSEQGNAAIASVDHLRPGESKVYYVYTYRSLFVREEVDVQEK